MTIHTLTLEWQGITIDIIHDDEWSNYPELEHYAHHLEIRRRDEGRLPMSETGYHSHFMIGKDKIHALQPYTFALQLVEAWLKEAGQSKTWKSYVESQKQLTLF